jgi:hypothetical protein
MEMSAITMESLMNNKFEVTTYYINDENTTKCPNTHTHTHTHACMTNDKNEGLHCIFLKSQRTNTINISAY